MAGWAAGWAGSAASAVGLEGSEVEAAATSPCEHSAQVMQGHTGGEG